MRPTTSPVLTRRCLGSASLLALVAAAGCSSTTAGPASSSSAPTPALPTPSPAAHQAHWGYSGHEGPEHWGELDHAYASCSTGKAQSPIDLSGAVDRDLPDLHLDYRRGPLVISNPGHTVMVTHPAGSTLEVGGRSYTLLQYHLHTPSEHTLDKQSFPAELHLVHRDAQQRLAVVGVLLKSSRREHAGLARLLAHLPSGVGTPAPVAGATSDPASLLPADRRYRSYSGSLTTPPCSEGVNWFVLDQPLEVSAAQLAALQAAMGHNARPVQPLDGRTVRHDGSR